MMTYCDNCEASLTETDFDCGRCTQCGHQITTEETKTMLNTRLLARPFSYDRPRVEGYRPIISGRVTRISRSRRNAWRAETLVDGCAMSSSHHDTKADAETELEGMIKAYVEAHYIQV